MEVCTLFPLRCCPGLEGDTLELCSFSALCLPSWNFVPLLAAPHGLLSWPGPGSAQAAGVQLGNTFEAMDEERPDPASTTHSWLAGGRGL